MNARAEVATVYNSMAVMVLVKMTTAMGIHCICEKDRESADADEYGYHEQGRKRTSI